MTGQPNLNPAGSTTRPTTSPVQISSPIPSSSSSPIAPLLSSSLPPLAADATPFEIVLHQAHIAGTMPGPGLSYFEARRALWSHPPANPPTPADPSPSRVKLEALLSQPGAVESEEVWRAGLKNVWKGLVGGNQLRQPLPLNVVVRSTELYIFLTVISTYYSLLFFIFLLSIVLVVDVCPTLCALLFKINV